jgi:hypothetical protein
MLTVNHLATVTGLKLSSLMPNSTPIIQRFNADRKVIINALARSKSLPLNQDQEMEVILTISCPADQQQLNESIGGKHIWL